MIPAPLPRSKNPIQELVGMIALGLSPLWVGFIVSQFVSAYAIPSRSMDSTLMVGDVVLADKVSPKLHLPLERGDIIFFRPPEELAKIAEKSGSRIGGRDLVVKRVAGIAGDNIRLDDETDGQSILIDGSPYPRPASGCRADLAGAEATVADRATVPAAADSEIEQRLEQLRRTGKISSAEADALLRDVTQPEATDEAVESVLNRSEARISTAFPSQDQELLFPVSKYHTQKVSEHSVFVLGDCAQASTDSRYWGELPESLVVGRPFLRVWPPNRIGAVDKTADLNPFRRSFVQFREEVDAKLPTLR
jgi:signal peptidase I